MKNLVKVIICTVFAMVVCSTLVVKASDATSSDNITSVKASHILVDTMMNINPIA